MRMSYFTSNTIISILLIALVFLTIIIIALWIIGNYFFKYSLKRSHSYPEGGNRCVKSVTPEKSQKIIDERKNYDESQVKEWLKNNEQDILSMDSDDGVKLVASIFKHKNPSSRYAIIAHGYTQDKSYIFDICYNYFEKGYNVLAPDFRGHGESGGEYLGMGWKDREDIILWIKKIIDDDPDCRIILHGVSMGASAVLMVSGEKLPKNVCAIVEDCGYTSAYEIFESELRVRFNLPPFPILDAADIVTKIKTGYGLKTASSINQIKKTNVPILFIHGCYDNFVPAEMAYRMYDICAGEKELFVVEEAGHNESRFLEHEKYYNSVFNFINRYI